MTWSKPNPKHKPTKPWGARDLPQATLSVGELTLLRGPCNPSILLQVGAYIWLIAEKNCQILPEKPFLASPILLECGVEIGSFVWTHVAKAGRRQFCAAKCLKSLVGVADKLQIKCLGIIFTLCWWLYIRKNIIIYNIIIITQKCYITLIQTWQSVHCLFAS